MGGIDNGKVDVPDWTPELIRSMWKKFAGVRQAYFIPALPWEDLKALSPECINCQQGD